MGLKFFWPVYNLHSNVIFAKLQSQCQHLPHLTAVPFNLGDKSVYATMQSKVWISSDVMIQDNVSGR